MKCEIIDYIDHWQQIKNKTMNTIGKTKGLYPTSEWKKKMLRCEHSPIRSLNITVRFTELPYWVSVHLTRHKIGVEHFVSTQRDDRNSNSVSRNDLPQSALVSHTMELNANAIINISNARLCHCASKETVDAWTMFIKELEKYEPELASLCVPHCVYRSKCPEFVCCGYDKSDKFKKEFEKYWEV